MPQISSEQSRWLKDHSLCIFATGRKDGSPQQSYIVSLTGPSSC